VTPDPLATLPVDATDALPLHLVTEPAYARWVAAQPAAAQHWLQRAGFRPERGKWLVVPDASGAAALVCAGVGNAIPGSHDLCWLGAALSDRLPPGDYRLAPPTADALADRLTQSLALGWGIGGYRFARYRPSLTPARARLVSPTGADRAWLAAAIASQQLARDLINTPANDMGPEELTSVAAEVAQAGPGVNGSIDIISGAVLEQQFPLIAAVGRGSPRAPRLIDMRFARPGAPRITLVGKGVCFDTGGLDIKAPAGMLLMKKDMGGAACALATATMLRMLDVKVELRVLIPAVENSVDGAAYRPGDVVRSRKGLSVEIGNTDAEGRLVLADALTLAGEDKPDLIIDLATLTGAARIALGAELPPVYGGDAVLLAELVAAGNSCADPLWPMPLWDGYDDELSSRIADVNNAPSSGMAGSVTAALFLRRFVADPQRWLHLDIYGWNAKDRPGRPVGAEAQGVRAIAGLLRQRYG
jgi:leucyl aminopeptidase